jgi:hypothetical protein
MRVQGSNLATRTKGTLALDGNGLRNQCYDHNFRRFFSTLFGENLALIKKYVMTILCKQSAAFLVQLFAGKNGKIVTLTDVWLLTPMM